MANYTTKQMGDACEMLVAAELTLAGVPAMKAPDYWPGHDAIAQPVGMPPQRISVKSRTYKRGAAFVRYSARDAFEWLAIVVLPGNGCTQRRIYVIPREVADAMFRFVSARQPDERECNIDQLHRKFAAYEGNFGLNPTGSAALTAAALTRATAAGQESAVPK
jgi:hypothetical protein